MHDHLPAEEEIEFAQMVVEKAKPGIIYARVDVMRDNSGKLSLGELEVFEPALWLRKHPPAAELLAGLIAGVIRH